MGPGLDDYVRVSLPRQLCPNRSLPSQMQIGCTPLLLCGKMIVSYLYPAAKHAPLFFFIGEKAGLCVFIHQESRC